MGGLNDFFSKFLDPYDRPARLYPGLIVFAPFAVLLVCLYGSEHALAYTVVSTLGFCGIAYAISRVVRDRGRRLQDGLFEKWGGAPSTQLLRHSHPLIDIHTKERIHEVLGKAIRKAMPTQQQEEADLTAADQLYRAGAGWLIENTRDTKKFALIFKENVSFGFFRNMLGMRRIGMTTALISIFWVLVHAKVMALSAPFLNISSVLSMDTPSFVSIGVSFIILIAWSFQFTESAAREAGFAYAERLIKSTEMLKAKVTTAAKPKAKAESDKKTM